MRVERKASDLDRERYKADEAERARATESEVEESMYKSRIKKYG
jgi:hypothetical protein